jgi:hypothetical protein
MRLIKFSSYQEYLDAQELRSKSLRRRSHFLPREIYRVCEYIKRKDLVIADGVCHGARTGLEVDEFKKWLPVSMFGTDLFPKQTGNSKVVQWDFNRPKGKWRRRFDLIYSNSLDHSPDPERTLQVWMNQLTSSGLLVLQWSSRHTRVRKADCFGGSLLDYLRLINLRGVTQDLIYTSVRRRRRRSSDVISIVARAKR